MLYNPQLINNLPSSLDEWSGMVYWDGLFWGHNDGGNGAYLYALRRTKIGNYTIDDALQIEDFLNKLH